MIWPPSLEPLGRLAAGLAIGLLIGLERGWEQREFQAGERVAGFRTFGLIGLLGAVSTMISSDMELAVAAAFLGVAALTAIGYWRESADGHHLGDTTAVAALITFALGALAGIGRLQFASSTAVVVALILSFKPEMHRLLEWIDRDELLATLRLLLISVVLLPILPNRGYGPWEALNPYHLWWMVVLVASISYIGYFAIKSLGKDRGVFVTGLFGGLVSSTAVAVSLARRAVTEPETEGPAAPGIVVASAIMFPRIFVIVAPVAPVLVQQLAWPLVLAGLVAAGVAYWYERSGKPRQGEGVPAASPELELRNPVDLRIALQFGAMLAVIMLAARGIIQYAGNNGLYLVAAADGLVDVDAISLSAAAMAARSTITPQAATIAILIAATVNTVVKPAIVFVISGPRLGTRVALPLAAALIAGAAGLWISMGG